MLPAMLGLQASSPLERPLPTQQVWVHFWEMGGPGCDGGGRPGPTGQTATKQAGPLPCPWGLAEGPFLSSGSLSFLWLLSPAHQDLLLMCLLETKHSFLLSSARGCQPEACLWARAPSEPLNPAGVLHVKSQGQADTRSVGLRSSPKPLQVVKLTQPERGLGSDVNC